jgi:hypothetical protein
LLSGFLRTGSLLSIHDAPAKLALSSIRGVVKIIAHRRSGVSVGSSGLFVDLVEAARESDAAILLNLAGEKIKWPSAMARVGVGPLFCHLKWHNWDKGVVKLETHQSLLRFHAPFQAILSAH